MTPVTPWIKPLILIAAPLLLIWLARRRWRLWRRLRLASLALAVWLLCLLPVCQVMLLAVTTAVVEASRLDRVGGDLTGVPYADLIQAAAAHHNLDPALIAAVIEQESAFQPAAISRAGAMGLMQIMPATAADLGLMQPYNPAANIEAGTRYLAWLLERYGGDVRLALAAYNAGPGRVDRCQCIPTNGETPGYVVAVLAAADRYRQREGQEITLPYRGRYRLINNGLHGDGYWPGRDFAAACGTPLYAPLSGRVATGFDDYIGPYGSNNSYLRITGEGGITVMMMHGEYVVSTGQSVSQGDLVGFEASIGNSTECHTHLAIRVQDELVDPIYLVR